MSGVDFTSPEVKNQTEPTSPEEPQNQTICCVSRGLPPNYTNISRVSQSNHFHISRDIKTIPSQHPPSDKTIPSQHLPSDKTIPSQHLPSIQTTQCFHIPSHENHFIFISSEYRGNHSESSKPYNFDTSQMIPFTDDT